MRIFTLSAIAILSSQLLSAQISHGGQPLNWSKTGAPEPRYTTLPAPDLEKYAAEDALNDQYKEIPYRFGATASTQINLNNSGEWLDLGESGRVWRTGIHSPGAVSINLEFGKYQIPEGGKVFVYRPDLKQVLGSFTRENASAEGTLGVGLVAGDKIIVEYHEPASAIGEGQLEIASVTHGYRSIMPLLEEMKAGPFGNSGPCNINVNCPEGLPFDIQKRSVALIVVGTNAICSGALVNNTAQNGTPYFLTANHCLGGNVSNWVFYFNHEAPNCSGNTGPINQSISGASLLASSAESDFALLQLNSAPPASFNACYSGWDATDLTSTVPSAYGIHHPSGDVKKICFENNAPFHQNMGTFVNQTWYINQWELGVTEGGSSGSPLFNPSGRIIGMLSGGLAACQGSVNNGQYDFYGRFGVAWDFGSSASSRLRDWLDPGNSGLLILNNSCAGANVSNDVTLGILSNIQAVQCGATSINPEITVLNTGTNAVTAFSISYTLNGGAPQTVNWNGNLAPSASTNAALGAITPAVGNNVLIVQVTSVNGVTDQNTAGNTSNNNFDVIGNPAFINLTINFDNYPGETTWNIATQSGSVLYSGGPYPGNTETFSADFCLDANVCYNFTIFDQWNDGICCGFGEGSYSLTNVSTNTLIFSGGEFGSSETTEICPILSANESGILKGIHLYPNPARSECFIDAGSAAGFIDDVTVFDPLGRRVWSANTQGTAGLITVPLQPLQKGVYLVQIRAGAESSVKKLIVN